MIGFLTGQVISKQKNTITLLAGPIGYEVHLSSSLWDTIEVQQKLDLFIHTKVREDDISLFGFAKATDLEFFRLLLGVNGVGPKTALEILSNDINQIKNAILQENAAFLSKVPGIGKKTAERIILDLKGKVEPESLQEIPAGLDQKLEEVIGALMSLGYQRGEIYHVFKNTSVELNTTEEMITFFLKNV
jgi:Holliday junction DNA helicase RuvA